MTIDVIKIFQDYGVAFASRDMKKILSFYNDDLVYKDLPSGTINRNKQELKQFFEKLLATMPDVNKFGFLHCGIKKKKL